MRFHIREATQKDYKGISEIFEEVDSLHRKALPHIFQETNSPPRTEEFISSIISDENAGLFVAETDGQIIGLVHVLIRQTLPIPIMVPRRYAVLENLAVREGTEGFPIRDITKHLLSLIALEAEIEYSFSFDPSYEKLAKHLEKEKEHFVHRAMALRKELEINLSLIHI